MLIPDPPLPIIINELCSLLIKTDYYIILSFNMLQSKVTFALHEEALN